jgi:hypothetical protein
VFVSDSITPLPLPLPPFPPPRPPRDNESAVLEPLTLFFQQDSSLGSFEGEPVVSDESLPEIGLRAARADLAGLGRRSYHQRPVTTSVEATLYENKPLGSIELPKQAGRVSYGAPTSSGSQVGYWCP